LSSSSSEAKNRQDGIRRSDRPFKSLAFPEYHNILDGILETQAFGGGLRAQQFQFGAAKVGHQPRDLSLFLWFLG
jgi:hypothetical protein